MTRLGANGGRIALVAIVVVSSLLAAQPIAAMASEAAWEGRAVSEAGGLIGTSMTQTVSGQPHSESLCANPTSTPSTACVQPGGLTYVNWAQTILATMHAAYPPNSTDGLVNGTEEVNPVTGAAGPVTPLGCSPYAPFYPGYGNDVFIPCYPSSVVVENAVTGSIVATIPTSITPFAMTYDPGPAVVFAGNYNNDSVVAISAMTLRVTDEFTFAGADFEPAIFQSPALGFDSYTNELLSVGGSGSDQLLAMSPSGGPVRVLADTGYKPIALSVDPWSPLIFVSLDDPEDVLVYSATTYQQLANLTLPNCFDQTCGASQVLAFAYDRANGDAYLSAGLALYAVNVSTLAIVGTVQFGAPNLFESLAFDPTTDEVWGAIDAWNGAAPAYMASLTHGNATALSELLWLPTGIGALLLAILVGGVLAIAVVLGGRRKTRSS